MHNEHRKGVALIIVLAILVLVTALVVGFLVRTGSERTAAASYRATARTRQLADTVVNLVQAQINQGTVATTGSVTTSGSAWASQPGAIRVFDGLGNQTIYKLYSSGTMVTTNYSTIAGDMPPASPGNPIWQSDPSQWVDLNAPAAFTISGSAALAYPILDPRNPNPSNGGGDFTTGNILTGFQVNQSVVGLTESGTNPVAPMPSQWLYVLQDGTIVPPGLGSTGTSVIITATNVSASNPIVGRIAFWTDDDTCRVNINTAGDGTFWDTPRYTAPDEWVMGFYSPASYEYQRYPGHPATTSLLPVLAAVNPIAFPSNTYQANYSITLPTTGAYFSYQNNSPYQTSAYQNLFSLTPQYAYGGSAEASVSENVAYSNASEANSSNSCPLNSQRLYSSVGELMYSSSNNGASPPVRTLSGGSANQLLNRQQLETAKFFLTAHSRAPELNLFGTPRVSIWPFTIVNSGSTSSGVSLSGTQVVQTSVRNTAIDSLLAFASTINATGTNPSSIAVEPFYFMRASNYDPYTDLDIGRNGSNQNEQVLDYLDSLMSLPVPGFSTLSFDNKYSSIGSQSNLGPQTGGRQILAEIFDYIRTVDTEDGVVIYNKGANNGLGNIFGQSGNVGNIGIVVPTLNTMWAATSGTLEGFGTFPRPTCVMIHFVGLGQGPITSTTGTYPGITVPTQDLAVPAYSNYDTTNISTSGTVTANRVAVQAYVYVQFVVPATARLDSNPEVFWITMTGLQTLGLTVSGTTVPLGFPSTSSEAYSINLGGGLFPGPYENDQFTGDDSIFGLTDGRKANSTVTPGGNGSVFAFFSQIVTLPYNYVAGGTNYMVLTGGSNVVMTLQDASPGTNVIQTVHLNFAQAAKAGPIPFPVDPSNQPGTTGAGIAFSSAGFLSIGRMLGTQTTSTNGADVSQNDRFGGYGQNYFDQWHDSAASLVLSSSSGWDDLRTLCVANVPANAFVAHQDWGKIPLANDFVYGSNFDPFPGNPASATTGTSGVLVAGAKYVGAMPCVPSQSAGVAFQGGVVGDWDNGVGWTSDGPWINRPDEGGATTGVTSGYTNVSGMTTSYYEPYFTAGNGTITMGPGVFSPNREMPSPVMFGSLPTGVDPSGVSPQHWRTLLFRPGQAINHFGEGLPTEGQPPYTTVPDHLLLDLFWMPVTEPYAISEPFSTAGKVNLNYQILPFGYVSTSGTTAYIRRDTGIRSALQSLKIAAVPLSAAGVYKSEMGGNWWGQFPGFQTFSRSTDQGNLARLPIDVNQTLQQFDSNFDNGRVFQSASEICDLYLVPQGYTLSPFNGASGADSWYGSDFALVGDNVRERPYADIYSRITTKSNTFTVYFTVQELKNSPSSPPDQWNEATGTIVGEYRGSKDMERYIQQSTSLPNFLTYPASNPVLSGTASLEPYYRWRIIEDNQFAP